MSELAEIKSMWEEMQRLYRNDFKSTVDKAQGEIKSFGSQLGETKEVLAKMNAAFDKLEERTEELQKERAEYKAKVETLEKIVADLNRPSAGAPKTSIPEGLEKFYSEAKAFTHYVRTGQAPEEAIQKKTLATDAGNTGGFLVPANTLGEIIRLNYLGSPVRKLCTERQISVGNSLEITREGSTAYGITTGVGERATRVQTPEGTFELLRIPVHEDYAYPWATMQMLEDTAFGLEAWISELVAKKKAQNEGAKFINGTGFNEPQGIANGGSSQINVTTSDAFTAAKLITFQYSLEEPYASNATWLSKRANFGQIRQLTATTGDFLWQPGLQAGEPPLLLNRPIVACNDITLLDGTATSSTQVIYFGDFKAGYTIVDRLGMTMVRDAITAPGFVKFHHRWRYGGQVVLPEAIKIGVAS